MLRGGRPGPTVLLRADMDALPVTEANGSEFASRIDGVMHACGHDLHTAMLAGVARILSGRQPDMAGSVIFMFQPGEENGGGARVMIDQRDTRRGAFRGDRPILQPGREKAAQERDAAAGPDGRR